MPTAARPADVVETLVERAQTEGPLSPEQLRATFEQAGIGPAEAGAAYGGQAASSSGRKPEDKLTDRDAADALEDREEFISDDEESDTEGPW